MSDYKVTRIPGLPVGTTPKPGYKLAVWNSETNVTEQMDVEQFLVASTSGNYDWVNTTSYGVDEVVFYNGQLWASLQAANVGNTPQNGAWWISTAQQKGSSLIGWAAGTYTEDEVYVTHNPGAGKEIYELVAVARPYLSANIATEIAAGDWVLVSASAASDLIFDGQRAIKRVPQVGDNFGTTSLLDFIEEAFFPELVALITQATQALHEVGESFAPTIIGTIDPKDSTINSRRVREVVGNTVVANPATNAVNELLAAVTIVSGITKTYRIEADVTTDGDNTTEVSPDVDLEGVYPFFYGMEAAGKVGLPLYQDLIKLIQKQIDKVVNLNGTNLKMYYAYPATYPDLTSIKDPSGFEALGGAFPSTPTTALVTSENLGSNWSVNYKIYESNNLVTVAGDYEFIF